MFYWETFSGVNALKKNRFVRKSLVEGTFCEETFTGVNDLWKKRFVEETYCEETYCKGNVS